MDTLISGQKRTVDAIDRISTRIEYLTAEMEKFSRQQVTLKSELTTIKNELLAFRAEATSRADAIASRLDDIEQIADRISQDVHASRAEIVGQQNDILNAVQSGLAARLDLNGSKNELMSWRENSVVNYQRYWKQS
jgi:predicted  nucleic acid-binding Zn-ribbon protein